MIGELTYEKVGERLKVKNGVSPYNPSQKVKEVTQVVKHWYEIGDEVLNRQFEEFNGKSVIGRMNEDQKAWLSWNPPASGDPEDDWRWFGVRPITRNKIISTAAHLTEQIIAPRVFAQNERDEADRDAAYIMEEMIEWNIQNTDYEMTFMYGVISALINPATYFHVDYVEAMHEIWKGKKREKVKDEILSGFQFNLIPADEVLITNPYVFDIQHQPAIIRTRKISYDEAQALYGEHENFKYVRPGVKSVYSSETGLFYDVQDDNNILVEEAVISIRSKDFESPFVNGVYLGNANPEYNPMSHRTIKGNPKYPYVKMGAEPIDAKRFFYYKSIAAKMSNDQELYDRMWQMAMDGTFLATFPPVFTMGAGKIDKSVIVPATVTDIALDAKIQPVTGIANPVNTFIALREAERSLSESSQDPQLEGKVGKTPQTARQSMLIQENAQKGLTLMSKMIGNSVKEVGELMIDCIIHHQTIGEVEEILGGVPKMKFRSFVLDKVVNGSTKSEYIRFTDASADMDKEMIKEHQYSLLDEAGDDREIYEVNPEKFSKLNFLCSIDYDEMKKRSSRFEDMFKLEVYDRAISSPFVDQEALTRDFLLEPLVKGDAVRYMKKVEGMMPQEKVGVTSNMPSRVTQSAAMDEVIS